MPAAGDPLDAPALAGIDVEARLDQVKRAAGRAGVRRFLSSLAGGPGRAGGVLVAVVGSACATTALVAYRRRRYAHPAGHPVR
jgi:hypothetical protein